MKGAAALFVLPALTLAACLASCGGETATLGLSEPLRVKGATLHDGDLPGSPPLTDEQVDGGVKEAKPYVTTVMTQTELFHPGATGIPMSGGVTDDADSVAVRFSDLGDGYWVVPASAPDPMNPGTLTWSMSIDVSQTALPGLHPLRFVGIDDQGTAGTQIELPTCIDTPYPDNLNVCDPMLAPPFAVLSLDWDSNSDLDLELQAPDGKLLDPKHPTTAADVDGGVAPSGPSDGKLDHDSNANCVIDGIRREDVVWQMKPASGQYYVYVNMYAACGQSSARFNVTLYLATTVGDHQELKPAVKASGELLASDANAGMAVGLFVTQFQFQ